ncbi:type II secretion system protein GspG [Luteolibacter arcticus]|uniref:Type II secretion system protein GspG n=1 Tax=Luteolibacter arcticus TaxID=1581411 RepID=A0ABT3GNQ0_9BACT|nr:type II secretion system protein GspG [Luteolibacter arcticus]MCW1925144.1 type II secretion system protein GspG [Luteolibacter arcticus]
MGSTSSALKMFKLNAGRYPTEEEGLMALIEKPATYPENKRWQRIMDRVPHDPWNRPYQYAAIGDSTKIDRPPSWTFDGMGLYSFGPDGISNSKGNDPDDYSSWDESSWDRRSSFERWKDSPAAGDTGIAIVAVLVCAGLLRVWHVRASN